MMPDSQTSGIYHMTTFFVITLFDWLFSSVSLNNCGNSQPLPLCPNPMLPEAVPFSFQPTAVYYHFL